MLSNLSELSGLGLVVTAVWWLAGRPFAFLVAGVFLVVIGVGLDSGRRTRTRVGAGRLLSRLGSALERNVEEPGSEDDE